MLVCPCKTRDTAVVFIEKLMHRTGESVDLERMLIYACLDLAKPHPSQKTYKFKQTKNGSNNLCDFLNRG